MKRVLEENILLLIMICSMRQHIIATDILQREMSKLIRHRTVIDGLQGEYHYRKKRSYFW